MTFLRYLTLLLCVAACGRDEARVESVALRQSEVTHQGKTNFCWAFSLVSWVEAFHLSRRQDVVHLDPAYLGFYSMAHALLKNLQEKRALKPEVFASAMSRTDIQGNFVAHRTLPDSGLELLKRYGIIRKGDWRGGFDPAVTPRIVEDFIAARNAGRLPADSTTVDDILEIMVGPGKATSKPPATVVVGERTVTPVQFLREILGFEPDDYTEYGLGIGDFDGIIDVTKKTLSAGLSVPLTTFFSEDPRYLKNGVLDFVPATPAETILTSEASYPHAMLVVDFVNRQSAEGSLSSVPQIQQVMLDTELARPASALDYLVIKNSLGPQTGRRGYFHVRQSFIQHMLSFKYFSVVVPKSVLE